MRRVSVTRTGAEVPANSGVRARRAPVSERARQAFLDRVTARCSATAVAKVVGVCRFYELRDR